MRSAHPGRPGLFLVPPSRWVVGALMVSLCPSIAQADVDARRLFHTLTRDLPSRNPAEVLRAPEGILGITAELPPGAVAETRGLVSVAGPYAVARGSVSQLLALMGNNPDVRFHWAPPFRPQLDTIQSWSHAEVARVETGLTGAGVVVGVIDTGVDTKHPGLQNPDGSTRVRWLIDFGERPLGLHPDLEAMYGCTESTPCAVLSAEDIDERLANDIEGDESTDAIGHGTHVASIAAGNGAPDGRYMGVAPEADLIVAQVGTRPSGSITDVNILTAARFIFDRAEEEDRPSVLNVSLGSNFGAHDGSSSLEMGLAALLDRPGRVLVTAAGNSAGQFRDLTDDYEGPFGIHTEVHVAPAGVTRVPVLTPAIASGRTEGAVFAWISSSPGDDLRVGFSTGGGGSIPPVRRGTSTSRSSEQLGDPDDYAVLIINGVTDGAPVPVGPNSAVVILSGEWRAGRTFGLRLQGKGSARIWVEGGGDLDSSRSVGAVLPASRKAGTVAIPASHPALIAVGATINRTTWVDHSGNTIERPRHGALEDAPHDTTAFFSAAGPTSAGVLKPELVAPGVNIIAAMSREADPRESGNVLSQFSGRGQCGPIGGQCLVVDDRYALATGTSMAAPAVTGAVALLLQREPSLTQTRVMALLQAGSRPLDGVSFASEQAGAGALDVVGALLAQDAAQSAEGSDTPTEARIALAQSFVYPDPQLPLQGLVVLRDEQGGVPSGFDPSRLTAHARGASGLEFEPVTEGLWRLALAFPAGSAGQTTELTISWDGEPLASRQIPVAVDPHTAERSSRARGGCAVALGSSGSASWLVLVLGISLARRRVRRR